MTAALSALWGNLIATGSQAISGVTALLTPSLQATATTNALFPALTEYPSQWLMLREGHRGDGEGSSGGGSSPSPGGSPSPPHTVQGTKIPRLLSFPGTPWRIGTVAEKDISTALNSESPVEEKIRDVAIRLAQARAAMIRDPREARRVNGLALDVFFRPTKIAGREIHNVEDIEPALLAYLGEITGLEFPELPKWGERTAAIILRTSREKPDRMTPAFIANSSTYFNLRRYLWGESLFVPTTEQFLLRPEISGPEFSSGRLHEFEHLVGTTNGPLSRRAPKGLFGLGARLLSLANPLRFATKIARFLNEESHAVGAQWEIDHRISEDIRKSLRVQWRGELKGLGLTDQEIDSDPLEFRALLQKRVGASRAQKMKALYLYLHYHQMGFADLPKGEYIRRARSYAGYNLRGFLYGQTVSFRFFKEEQALGTFFTLRVVSALQFAGSTAIWTYLASRFVE